MKFPCFGLEQINFQFSTLAGAFLWKGRKKKRVEIPLVLPVFLAV